MQNLIRRIRWQSPVWQYVTDSRPPLATATRWINALKLYSTEPGAQPGAAGEEPIPLRAAAVASTEADYDDADGEVDYDEAELDEEDLEALELLELEQSGQAILEAIDAEEDDEEEGDDREVVTNYAGPSRSAWECLGVDEKIAASYWAFDLTGGLVPGNERNALLMEESKQMMYRWHQADPKRWTTAALAEHFGVREQRVAACIALKEHEERSGYDLNEAFVYDSEEAQGLAFDLAEICEELGVGEDKRAAALAAWEARQREGGSLLGLSTLAELLGVSQGRLTAAMDAIQSSVPFDAQQLAEALVEQEHKLLKLQFFEEAEEAGLEEGDEEEDGEDDEDEEEGEGESEGQEEESIEGQEQGQGQEENQDSAEDLTEAELDEAGDYLKRAEELLTEVERAAKEDGEEEVEEEEDWPLPDLPEKYQLMLVEELENRQERFEAAAAEFQARWDSGEIEKTSAAELAQVFDVEEERIVAALQDIRGGPLMEYGDTAELLPQEETKDFFEAMKAAEEAEIAGELESGEAAAPGEDGAAVELESGEAASGEDGAAELEGDGAAGTEGAADQAPAADKAEVLSNGADEKDDDDSDSDSEDDSDEEDKKEGEEEGDEDRDGDEEGDDSDEEEDEQPIMETAPWATLHEGLSLGEATRRVVEYQLWNCNYATGVGERHVRLVPTLPPKLKDLKPGMPYQSPEELAKAREQKEDEIMIREFKEHLAYNFGKVGQGISRRSRRKQAPKRPKEGWSIVVRVPGQEPYVQQPNGKRRALNESEALYLQRQVPKPRARIL